MKILRLSIFLLIVILSVVANIYYLKIGWYYFVGLFLALWLAYAFLSNFIIKFYKNKKGIPQEKYSYAFPDKMAKIMKKIDVRTQLEAALLAMFFILIGMVLLDIYMVFFMNFDWWFKGLILFNSFWGFAFLLTTMISQYQSYVTYMQTVEALEKFGDKGNFELNNIMKGGQ
jgi:hypothetical protein